MAFFRMRRFVMTAGLRGLVPTFLMLCLSMSLMGFWSTG